MITKNNKKGDAVMNVLKISDMKVKIMLTKDDALDLDLVCDNIDYSNPKTRHKIWEMLDLVKRKHGFDPDGYKLLIQFYPSKDGGAEIFVTKLENLTGKSERMLSRASDVAMLDRSFSVYNFDNLDDLMRVSYLLNGKKGLMGSELYHDKKDGYFLKLDERGVSKLGEICEFAVMLEFSSPIRKEKYPYIREHYDLLIEKNAVEVLASMRRGV